ncbi:MAG: Ig-like domain-containing protein, partial [Gemmatimonadales bacterium]|jgi:uncharacterized protein YjdB
MDRTLTVRARDARGIETHAGSTTVDVHPGANVQLNLTLEPVSGDVPITVELATYVVTLDPATATVAVNDMVQLAVAVEDGAGNPVFNPEVAWGSTHPDVAWVDQTGVLIAVSPGVATIAANYRGTVGLAEVTIF